MSIDEPDPDERTRLAARRVQPDEDHTVLAARRAPSSDVPDDRTVLASRRRSDEPGADADEDERTRLASRDRTPVEDATTQAARRAEQPGSPTLPPGVAAPKAVAGAFGTRETAYAPRRMPQSGPSSVTDGPPGIGDVPADHHPSSVEQVMDRHEAHHRRAAERRRRVIVMTVIVAVSAAGLTAGVLAILAIAGITS